MRETLLFSVHLTLLLLVTSAPLLAAEDSPVVYAPDVVGVDRIFIVALKVPTNASDVPVTLPDSIIMLDHTRPPFRTDIRRFYFRSVKSSPRAEIRFALPFGDVIVAVEIWSFEDLRKFRILKGVQLPRRWPLGKELPELKEKQVFPTGAEAKTGKGQGGWLNVPDDTIWDMQPDSTIPRWHWVNIQFGCPVHGTEIYSKGAYYPWIKDTSLPYKWKIKCPVGGETYPSNDFGAGDMTRGDFPDDGIGGGCYYKGKQYGFIAELAQAYCHKMLQVAPSCADSYVATGDVRYVHKALVAMCRLAVEYAYLATMTQHRHRNTVGQVERLGQGRFDEGPCLVGSGLTVYCIDQPTYQIRHAEAYDRIFPAIEKDPDIIPFLQKKGFNVKTHEDVRRFIEENLMAVWLQAAMDLSTRSNEPFHQWGLAKMAEYLNYRQGSDFLDWLYDGEGKMRVFVPNTYFRDGAAYESTGGYNSMHVTALGPIIAAVEHLREMRPEVYPETKYPSLAKSRRYRSVFDFCMDTVTIDRSFPQIGDGGSWPSYRKLPKITHYDATTATFEHAYTLFRAPKFAWALARTPGWKPSPDFPFSREQIEKEAAKWPDDWNDHSSLHDGYGIAILRGGKGDNKRAFWMNYGHNRGHSQDDTLDMGLQAFQGILLSHMGYPRNWGYWEYCWSSHNVARMFPYQTLTAQAQFLADAGILHVTEARATSVSDPEQNWQRRTLALIDVDPERFYCVDLYRIFGGQEHWLAFHAQEGDFTISGINLTKQQGGTLAGPDVPYGDANWLKANGCSFGLYGWRGVMFPFAHLYNVERGISDQVWSADWELKSGDGLHLRLTVPCAEGVQVNVCDGTSPAGGKPYEMKWIMLHNKGVAPVKTQILSILEPYWNSPTIRKIVPLKVSGEDEAGFAATGCIVHTADRTDVLLASADPLLQRTAEGGITFAGRFGLYAEQQGVPVAMSLIGGTRLSKGRFGISVPSAEYRAKVIRVNRTAETITASPAPPNPQAMVGEYVFITNPQRRVARKVLAAKPILGGVELSVDLDSRIGTGLVTGVGDYSVKTSTPFELQGFRYYLGARLVNADRTAEYQITEVASKSAALIDRVLHPDAKADRLGAQFPKDTWFDVYDFGVGDEVVWPYRVSVIRLKPNMYEICSPVEVKITLPHGSQMQRTGKRESKRG